MSQAMEFYESDRIVDQLVCEYDDTIMPLPDISSEPMHLISKVRNHYMEYIIRLLSVNYENNQKLLNKNIYLPSAIWRCAKNIELVAAQSCMVAQLYRKNINNVIKELKADTKRGVLNRKLYECLHKPPQNEKKTQTTTTRSADCSCQCTCSQRKKSRRSPKSQTKSHGSVTESIPNEVCGIEYPQPIPTLINSQVECQSTIMPVTHMQINDQVAPNTNIRMSVESQDDQTDDLMRQLEKLFQGDSVDDDLFEGALRGTLDTLPCNNTIKALTDNVGVETVNPKQDTIIESHSAQIKSLDERLASLTGLLANSNETVVPQQKTEPPRNKFQSSKWLCEEYFLKTQLFELMDQIRDVNRNRFAKIKDLFLELFGDDSDDEGVLSPLNETNEFITSCKDRIAPWVVKLLTPYYIKGRIRGKALFKSLAKHLIRLIYQCSKYPGEYEVDSFVTDFLNTHKMIRCEADFTQFRIENI